MAERIIDQRGGLCKQCGSRYQSLSQHWSRSQTCEYRSLSDHQLEIIRGLMLGDGSLDANKHTFLRCPSKRRRHLEWLSYELGWLSRGVTYDSSETYRLRTMSHPILGQYWPWTTAPTTDYSITPTAARVWYACDGTISFGGASDIPQITFAASADSKRHAIAQLLSQRGFTPLVWDRRVALPRDETQAWLNWIGEPSPGSEYKWCIDEEAYTQMRE